MANIFLSPENWEDENSNVPPIWWSEEFGEYQIFGDSPIDADVYLYMVTYLVSSGDTLEFNYNFVDYTPPPGQQGYLNVVRNGTEVVYSVALADSTNGSVSVSFPSGADSVAIILTISDESTNYIGFYLVDATLRPTPAAVEGFLVYELDKGWTFDGAYIPHFLELNWYFGEDPIHYHTIQKIRVHGLSKGLTKLTLAINGMQTDYEPDYTEPQILDLPRNPKLLSTDLFPETNYVDSANRGISLQMKFEGRNTDIALPEPQHALQVLVVQSSPPGTGFRSN